MGNITEPLPVKLIVPMFSGCPGLFAAAEGALVAHFGPVDYRSVRLPFTHTTYYAREFGEGLERQFLAFERLIDPGRLAEIKLLTNALEETFAEGGRRRINLDPGYISEAKLVLATAKNHGHRIYLGRGIYAEVTLTYRDKDFRPWPWTYPDYQSEPYLRILRAIRGIYVAQLRAMRHSGAE
jgi:hypothetical protein